MSKKFEIEYDFPMCNKVQCKSKNYKQTKSTRGHNAILICFYTSNCKIHNAINKQFLISRKSICGKTQCSLDEMRRYSPGLLDQSAPDFELNDSLFDHRVDADA